MIHHEFGADVILKGAQNNNDNNINGNDNNASYGDNKQTRQRIENQKPSEVLLHKVSGIFVIHGRGATTVFKASLTPLTPVPSHIC